MILQAIGEDVERPDLLETPNRVAKFFLSYAPNKAEPKMTTFENSELSESCLVTVANLEVRSMCAHHLLPFFGEATISYVPRHKKAGLSKFQRAIDYLAEKPQDQETLTTEILDYLFKIIDPKFMNVTLECSHTCMIIRGVKSTSSKTTTSISRGIRE